MIGWVVIVFVIAVFVVRRVIPTITQTNDPPPRRIFHGEPHKPFEGFPYQYREKLFVPSKVNESPTYTDPWEIV
jgi:hypothetical protein